MRTEVAPSRLAPAVGGRKGAWIAIAIVLGALTACVDQTTDPGQQLQQATTKAVDLPNLPEDAKVRGETGADAFVAHYYDLVRYGQQTGEWKQLKRLSAPSCEQCRAFWRESSPRVLDHGKTELYRASTVVENDRATVSISVTEQVETKTEDRFAGRRLDVVTALYSDGAWVIEGIEVR